MSEQPPAHAAPAPPEGLRVIGAADVIAMIEGNREGVLEVVREAYLAHADGASANPHSSFLRFPGRPDDRIIALPAFLDAASDGGTPRSGIKWVASYPGNVAHGFPRASAAMLLNDYDTGYPYAVLEASIISATRTAASAVLGAQELLGARRAGKVGFVGTGLISDHVRMFLRDLSWDIGEFALFDTDRGNAERFSGVLAADGPAAPVTVVDDVSGAFDGADLVVVATVAGTPHLADPALVADAPVVLHLSLRDFAPELVLAATNVTDDVEHAVRERTSLHLAEQQAGHREFVDGTIADVVRGDLARDPGKAAIFAPFGLGVLDVAVGGWVHDEVAARGGGQVVGDFFAV
ncbi:2,3-diaminopropionate biosynthesis protein SbnB [Prauserella halophila]|uniref:2,3-diaminopropionate biosynthesis protein SbnB n=1 Tax=Prauserella halophila TaxID=185641 RepID=A0ABN1W3D5_9PSEU|nr:2,3-diaminopropionate biosynthesis protein SbnB [Prauserella halophila]MCP2235331.1 ornithine cyclodeaminase [Prauserella halophila]